MPLGTQEREREIEEVGGRRVSENDGVTMKTEIGHHYMEWRHNPLRLQALIMVSGEGI